jgi:hypothetical protein
MSFWRALKCSELPDLLPASKRPRIIRLPTSMCACAASSSGRPSACLKALSRSASSPLRRAQALSDHMMIRHYYLHFIHLPTLVTRQAVCLIALRMAKRCQISGPHSPASMQECLSLSLDLYYTVESEIGFLSS